MATTWGAEELPALPSYGEAAAGDRGISVLGSFLQAAINLEMRELWNSVAPGTRAVEHVFTWDPKDKFHEGKLPAIYLFPESSTTEVEADGYDKETRVLNLYWLTRTTSPTHEVLRKPAQNLIGKAIYKACKTGRCKDWVVPYDQDPSALECGSFVLPFCGFESLKRLIAKPLDLTIQIKDGTERSDPFRGWATQIQTTEYLSSEVEEAPNKARLTVLQANDPTQGETDEL